MPKADVIIFSGQSNMVGCAECLSDVNVVDGAFEYKYFENALVPLKNPVGEDITLDGERGEVYMQDDKTGMREKTYAAESAAWGHINLVPAFCRAYVKNADSTTVAVHIARSATEISEWMPETPRYAILKKKASLAIEAVKASFEVRNVYFVWLQGESDAIAARSKEYYKQKIAALNDALKNDLDIDKFGIIRVGRFTNDERDDAIISAQDEICAENSDFLMLTTIAAELCGKPEYMHPAPQARGHYSAKGLELLGNAAGETLGRYSTN